MAYGFLDIAATASVKEAQRENGSADYWAGFHGERTYNRFTEAEAAFIAARDSFYMATVSESGWAYGPHRAARVYPHARRQDFGRGGLSRQPAVHHRRQCCGRRPRVADPDGLSEPPAAENFHSPRDQEPGRRSGPGRHGGDARLQGEAGTRAQVPPRRLRLELPATHHAAFY